jgi:hypothetical protein
MVNIRRLDYATFETRISSLSSAVTIRYVLGVVRFLNAHLAHGDFVGSGTEESIVVFMGTRE